MGVTQVLGKNKSHYSVYLNTGRGLLPEGLTTSLFRLLTQHTHTLEAPRAPEGNPAGLRHRPLGPGGGQTSEALQVCPPRGHCFRFFARK